MSRCVECAYYAPAYIHDKDGRHVTLTHGECRRNPPVSTVLKDAEGLWVYSTDWPGVVDGDWCGEFKKMAEF